MVSLCMTRFFLILFLCKQRSLARDKTSAQETYRFTSVIRRTNSLSVPVHTYSRHTRENTLV